MLCNSLKQTSQTAKILVHRRATLLNMDKMEKRQTCVHVDIRSMQYPKNVPNPISNVHQGEIQQNNRRYRYKVDET